MYIENYEFNLQRKFVEIEFSGSLIGLVFYLALALVKTKNSWLNTLCEKHVMDSIQQTKECTFRETFRWKV